MMMDQKLEEYKYNLSGWFNINMIIALPLILVIAVIYIAIWLWRRFVVVVVVGHIGFLQKILVKKFEY
jgi:hypothetical protein